MNIITYFTDSGIPAEGLSPTIRIRKIDGVLVIEDESMVETGDGFANVNAKSFNVFSPIDKDYQQDYLSRIAESTKILDVDGKLKRNYMFENERKNNVSITDFSKPIYNITFEEVCEFEEETEEDLETKESCKIIEVEVLIGYEMKYDNATDVGAMTFNNRLLLSEIKEFIINILNRLTGAEAKINSLETENNLIKSELCERDNSYSFCKLQIK